MQEGERVIEGTKRPDGTLRKERRVRAGYVPQDEQPVYVSRGTAMKQKIPKCPGFADTSQAPPRPKTKAAAKNAKRKEKKLAEESGSGGGAAAAVQQLSLGSSASSKANGGAAAAPTEPAGGDEGGPEKQLRTLRKKVRQAEALAAKQAEGKGLTEEEQAKLARLGAWQQEARQLEAQLAAGATGQQ